MRLLSTLFSGSSSSASSSSSSGCYPVAAQATPPALESLDRLRLAVAAQHEQWQKFELPRRGPLYQSLLGLEQDIDAATRKAHGRIANDKLRGFDGRLEDIRTQVLDFMTERGTMINARLRWQHRANATRFETATRLPLALAKEQRMLDAWSHALSQR